MWVELGTPAPPENGALSPILPLSCQKFLPASSGLSKAASLGSGSDLCPRAFNFELKPALPRQGGRGGWHRAARAASGSLPAFVNKVLLERSHARPFPCRRGLLRGCVGTGTGAGPFAGGGWAAPSQGPGRRGPPGVDAALGPPRAWAAGPAAQPRWPITCSCGLAAGAPHLDSSSFWQCVQGDLIPNGPFGIGLWN